MGRRCPIPLIYLPPGSRKESRRPPLVSAQYKKEEIKDLSAQSQKSVDYCKTKTEKTPAGGISPLDFRSASSDMFL